MKILLMDDDASSRERLRAILDARQAGAILEAPSLQRAIEILEARPEKLCLAVCSYRGGSGALLKLFLECSSSIPCVLLTGGGETGAHPPREAVLERLARDDLGAFERLVEQLARDGLFAGHGTPDAEFVRVGARNLMVSRPLRADIYLRLAPNRYCLRFRGEDRYETPELDRYFREKGIEHFYLRKQGVDGLLDGQGQRLDELAAGPAPPPELARQAASENVELVHDLIGQLGFTPRLQELTRKVVSIMLKALGNSPQLSPILKKLGAQDGKYIASHSVMLAEVACAIAHRTGRGSAPVFVKLALAAFLHDITLSSNRLARMRRLGDLKPGFTPEEEAEFRLHPARAAGYARQFAQLPEGVDTIVEQHHEQGDGSGFPRALRHHQLHPLSAVFIISHDLLHFFLDKVPTNQRELMLEHFLKEREPHYREGLFREISGLLRSGEAARG